MGYKYNVLGIGGLLLSGSLIWSAGVSAQVVERLYPATSCDTVQESATPADNDFIFLNSDESIEVNHGQDADESILIYCPLVRTKTGTAAGAKFFAYFNRPDLTNTVSCTLTSRRPHNGTLVSSATRSAGNNTGNIVLSRSAAPSSTFGPYALSCTLEGPEEDVRMFGYRLREF